jgi:hypothetical protein
MRTTLAAVAAIKVIRILKVQTKKKVSEVAYCYISLSVSLSASVLSLDLRLHLIVHLIVELNKPKTFFGSLECLS